MGRKVSRKRLTTIEEVRCMNLPNLTALELAAAYREGTLSPVEVAQAAIEAAEAWEPVIHAFITVTAERTLADAQSSEARYRRGQDVWAGDIAVDGATLHLAQHDPVSQRVTSQIVQLSAAGIRLYPVQIRYAWPSELDLMARLAGLRLRERWADWHRAPFSAASGRHISVYEVPPLPLGEG